MGVPVREDVPVAAEADLIVDGIIGYSLQGAPRGVAADLIGCTNGTGAAVLSLDTPSGIDLTSGSVYSPAVCADATMTLALPKKGLFHPDVANHRGALYLGDIGVPPTLYAAPTLGIKVPSDVFQLGDIVRLA